MNANHRNADETRSKLILATKDIIANEGYIGFSENKICELAGVTRGALRYHFPSGRYDLLNELIQLLFQQIPASDTQDCKSRILELIQFMQQNPVHNPLVLIMEIWHATFADKQLRESVEEVLSQRFRFFFNVDTLDELPEEIMPYRFMFWGAILSLQYHKNDKHGLNTIIEFMRSK
ncbi:TetR/AcrR family transcriptional regulator [Enterobacter bugandensis]|uniref:TetR/AcrR family transcriptional regulator n=1 Tax=Enterobacter bugandensis TaxID=881260 RepID=UPI0020047084|nr:TetR/AcrR family transcriptional regulator [Enterobacter bugandensis]MCK6964527.1 TetR/AcrR family transcriptional regulator [Enterobacter bugandensis]